MSFCPQLPLPKKMGRSPTPTAVSSVCAPLMLRADKSRPDWQIICDLARASSPTWPSALALAGTTTSPPRSCGDGTCRPDYAGITYERIDKVGIYPVPDMTHPGTPTLFTETFPRGRGKFTPLDYVPVMEEADDEYPFILTTGRVLEHWHGGTMTRNSTSRSLPRSARGDAPADAEIHGIRNGMPVRVDIRRGEVVLRATVTEKTTVGVVFIPLHFAEAAANLLTNDALDPQAKIPEFKACAVQVFPAREGELENPEAVTERGRY